MNIEIEYINTCNSKISGQADSERSVTENKFWRVIWQFEERTLISMRIAWTHSILSPIIFYSNKEHWFRLKRFGRRILRTAIQSFWTILDLFCHFPVENSQPYELEFWTL